MKEKEYILHLTEEQAKVLAFACEFSARVKLGQFQEIVYNCLDMTIPTDIYCERRDKAENLLFEARRFIYPGLMGRGHSYGIGHDQVADIAFGIYQVLRQKIGNSQERPFSYYDLPECEVVFDGKQATNGDSK